MVDLGRINCIEKGYLVGFHTVINHIFQERLFGVSATKFIAQELTQIRSLFNKFRDFLQPTVNKLGSIFAATGISPNLWTVTSLAFSITAGIAYSFAAGFSITLSWYYMPLLGSILLLISGFFDVVDGSVARITKQYSRKGAFLDSVFDKVAEAIIFIGLTLGSLASPVSCIVALALSLLVSYTRARGESLGIDLKGIGVGERAERLLIVSIIGMVPTEGALQIAVIIVSVVAGLTLIHRIIVALKAL
jgi:archaetidylinositol phosphate synthase